MKKITAVLLLILIALAGVKIIKEREKSLEKDIKPEAIPLVLEGKNVKKGKLNIYRKFTGTIYPEDKITVSSKITGNLLKLNVKEGDSVKKGQVLAVLDTRQTEEKIKSLRKELEYLEEQLEISKIKLKSAEANYIYVKDTYERDKILFENKAIPKETFEFSKLRLVKAEADLKTARRNIKAVKKKIDSLKNQINSYKILLEYGTVRSPKDGEVGKIFLYEGSFFTAGRPILEIYSGRKIVSNVPPEMYEKIKINSPVKIFYENSQIEGYISKKYKTSQIKLPQIEIKSPKIISSPVGVDIVVEILLDEAEGFIVPSDALLDVTGNRYVITENNGKLVKIPVDLIGIYHGKAVVKGDLKDGMVVAVGSNPTLRRALFVGKGKILSEGKK